jgi:asparagine synthase (glutamine-hydrolysing)
MCGILGIVTTTNCIKKDSFLQNLLLIKHRGPDDHGVFQDKDNNVLLGHTRLSILDLSTTGHQPMISNNENYIIVFNGEIYNFLDLRLELEKDGYNFNSNTDTEVLLTLFEIYGSNMLTKLNGIFALAIWNVEKKELFIARDAFGVKPLYFYTDETTFLFSSEIKSMINLLDKKKLTTDYDAINKYLTFLWCPGNGTPVNEIKKLGAGEYMIVKKSLITKHCKWFQLPYNLDKELYFNKKNSIEGTTNNLRNAVHRQMISDVPLGAFLSGGLDSSSIVKFASEINNNIQCFTIDTGGNTEPGITDDLPYAFKVAEHLKVPLHVIKVSPEEMIQNIEDMIMQLDEPLADPAALNVLFISKLAKEKGIKVLLSGSGGDDIFSGYRRHLAINFDNYFNWLPKNIKRYLELKSINLNTKNVFSRRLRKLLSGISLDENNKIVNYFIWSKKEDLYNLYTPLFKKNIEHHDAKNDMIIYLNTLNDNLTMLEKVLLLEQKFFLTDHNLVYTDKMSMAHGIEVRVPFLDLELVKFAANINPIFKQNKTTSKWVLKKAMSKYLPKNIIYRSKSGFGAPLRNWITNELKEYISTVLSFENIKKRGLFDPESIKNLILKNEKGEIDATYTIFSILCIELWFKKFID